MTHRLFLLLILPFLFLSSSSPAHSGAQLVQDNFPTLYQSVESVLGPRDSRNFFDPWTEQDIGFWARQNQKLLFILDQRRGIPGHSYLAKNFSTNFSSNLLETYGGAIARQGVTSEQGTYLTDEELKDLNGHASTRPDGLSYRIEDDSLVILKVVEVKAGAATYDESQARTYFKSWQNEGLFVRSGTGPKHFPASNIFLSLPERISLQEARLEDLQRLSLFFAFKPKPGFLGAFHQLPFHFGVARQIASHFFKTKGIDRLALLKTFIIQNSSWPEIGGQGLLERYLAKDVEQRGNRGVVFVRDLDEACRKVLFNAGQMPTSAMMNDALCSLGPDVPGALASWDYYKQAYPDAEKIEKIKKVLSLNPSWKLHFTGGCHPKLLNRLRRKE